MPRPNPSSSPSWVEVVQLEAGVDLMEALGRLGEAGGAWFEGVGAVEDPELAVAGPGGEERRTLGGTRTLVHLAGPAGGPFGVTLSGATDEVESVQAGVLVGGRAVSISVAAWTSSGTSSGWAARALMNRDADADEDDESDVLPEFNDRVIHPVFGLCEVMVVKGQRLKIRDVEGTHRLREIHLGVMKVLPPVEQEGRRVFRLVKR